jgi:hypothetical protein
MTSAVSGLSAALYRDETEEYVVTANLGSARDICFVSKNNTTPSIEIVVSGNDTALSVTDSGSDITVNSATDGSGNATSTAAQIVAAVNADAEAAVLWTARLPPGSAGAGVTGALAHSHGVDGVAFTQMSMVDSGDHTIWQAASGYRYWSSCSLIEKQVHGAGGWVDITSTSTINLIQGKITTAVALNSDDLVRVTGVRRSELAFQKVVGLFDGKCKIDGKDIDTSSVDDSGWGSSIIGSRSWEISAGAFYYNGSIPLAALAVQYYWKFYSVLATVPWAIGKGAIQSMTNLIANANDAQKQDVVVKGAGELYLE